MLAPDLFNRCFRYARFEDGVLVQMLFLRKCPSGSLGTAWVLWRQGVGNVVSVVCNCLILSGGVCGRRKATRPSFVRVHLYLSVNYAAC